MDDVNRLLDYLEIRSPATRQIYASMAQRRHLKKGEVLYRGGEDTTYLYFLISGCLRGYTVNANGREYTECILYRYGHSHIGEIGIEHEFRLNKNLEALTDADLLFFDIRPIMKELPNSIEFLRVYAKKLEEAYTQMWQGSARLCASPRSCAISGSRRRIRTCRTLCSSRTSRRFWASRR